MRYCIEVRPFLTQDTINGLEKTERRFTYDDKCNGLRTKKESDDKTLNYYYNGGKIVLETDKENAPTARNIWGLKLVYRENNPGQTDSQFLYYLHNAHGDVTQLLNEKGELIKDYRYDTFGQEEAPESRVFGGKQTTELWRQEVEKIDNPFRYAGEYLDEETGNYYLRARYYDPSVQRFINEDSFGVERGGIFCKYVEIYDDNKEEDRAMFAFCDESSFPRPSEDSDYSVLLAACVKAENIRSVTQRVYRLKENIFGGGNEVEIKAKNFIVPKTMHPSRSRNKLFVDKLFELIEAEDIGVYAIVMEKPDFIPYVHPSGYKKSSKLLKRKPQDIEIMD